MKKNYLILTLIAAVAFPAIGFVVTHPKAVADYIRERQVEESGFKFNRPKVSYTRDVSFAIINGDCEKGFMYYNKTGFYAKKKVQFSDFFIVEKGHCLFVNSAPMDDNIILPKNAVGVLDFPKKETREGGWLLNDDFFKINNLLPRPKNKLEPVGKIKTLTISGIKNLVVNKEECCAKLVNQKVSEPSPLHHYTRRVFFTLDAPNGKCKSYILVSDTKISGKSKMNLIEYFPKNVGGFGVSSAESSVEKSKLEFPKGWPHSIFGLNRDQCFIGYNLLIDDNIVLPKKARGLKLEKVDEYYADGINALPRIKKDGK